MTVFHAAPRPAVHPAPRPFVPAASRPAVRAGGVHVSCTPYGTGTADDRHRGVAPGTGEGGPT